MADFLNKKYKLVKSENFEEYMVELSEYFYTMWYVVKYRLMPHFY
jgi:hypothetical protein